MPIHDLLERDFGNLTELLRIHARERPAAVAITMDGTSIDYAAFDALVDRVAAALQRDGVKSGENISVCAKASIAYAALFLGALRAGVAVAPLAPSSTPAAIVGMINDCDARLVFLDASVHRELGAHAASLPVPVVALDGSDAGLAFEHWLAPADAVPAAVTIDPDQAFNIIYSSGTTGEPKGIVQSYLMRWRQLLRGPQLGYDAADVVTLVSTPLYSNTTLVCFLPTLAFGGTVVLMDKFDATRFLDLAQKHRATHAMLVPVQYMRIMAVPEFDRYDLSSFRMKLCTSAPFAASLKADILKRWPGGLIEYYGMTEGGGTCSLEAHLHPDKLHTVGKPMPGHTIVLLDEEGREVPQGEIGEVVGTSMAIMNGYYKRPDKTAAAEWFDANGTRYMRTGDVGRFDADGFLTLMDRKKDMIISGGFNVYPSDLEAELAQHPDVLEAAVVGVPSREWGETPVAFVVLKPGAAAAAEDLRAWTNARVGKTQRLSALKVVEQLPRSAIGKILKRELRDSYVAG